MAPQRSPFSLDISATDILSYVFPEGQTPSDEPVWIDADDTTRSLSPRQLLGWVKRLAIGLDRLGVKQHEIVMMQTSNHIFIPVLYLATVGSGRVFTGCSPLYGVNETAYQLENTGAKAVLVEPAHLETVLQAARKVGLPRDRIFLFDDKPCSTKDGIQDWRSMLGSEHEAERWKWHRMNPSESKTTVAVLNYSSGSETR